MALTPKQQAFIENYMIDLNATKAAIAAGYSPKTAQEQGSRLLSNVMVAKALEIEQRKRTNSAGITAEYVLLGIKGIADEEEGRNTDKLKAFELLGKHLKLFTENVNLSGTVAVKIVDDIE